MSALRQNSLERIMLDVSVTSTQKDALMTILKALNIEAKEHILSEEEEDLALGLAMEEGRKDGIADEGAKQDFESYLFSK